MDDKAIERYMKSPDTLSQFREVIGAGASAYVTSVLVAVSSSDKLQECSPASIVQSAIRAATLRLSVDPAIGEAHLVPKYIKDKGWTATFQLGYRGIYRMALRTGQYRYINDTRIFEGEEVIEDRITGLHRLEGHKAGPKWHAWLLAFELRSGFAKTFVMTYDELVEHGKRWGGKNPMWQSNFEAMARKTVYRIGLSNYGVFDPYDRQAISEDTQAQPEEEIITAEVVDVVDEHADKSEDQLLAELGFDAPAPAPAPEPNPAPARGVVPGLIDQIENYPNKSETPNLQEATKVYACLATVVGGAREKLLTRLDGKPFKAPKDLEPATIKVLFTFLSPQFDEKKGIFSPGNKIGADALKAEVATW